MLISNCESFRGRILFVSVIFILLHFPPQNYLVFQIGIKTEYQSYFGYII